MAQKISRRELVKGATVTAASLALAACSKPAEVVKETVVVREEVEKEVTTVVEKEVIKVVEATAPTGPTNAWGVTLPADALPLEEQFIWYGGGAPGGSATGSGGYGHIMEALYNRTFEHACGQETLTTLDTNFNVIGVGAESWEVAEDGSYWDFYLRKELVFSDGSPVTAHDWVYTMRWSLSHGYDFAWYYFDIKNASKVTSGELPPEDLGMEAVDDYTLRVYTETTVPYMPAVFIWFEVAKKDIWETAGENWALDPERYIASGPWILKEFERGAKSTWVPNTTYKGIRKPYITEVREWPRATGLPAYMAGEIHSWSIGSTTPAAEIALVNANPVLRAESHPSLPTNTDYMGFNTTGKFEALDNRDVRVALCKAIDKANLVGEIFQGFSYPTYGILPKGFPGYNEEELINLEPNVYDPEAAKQLLSKAGYPDGKGFPKYEMWIRDPKGKLLPLCQAIQARWKEHLGIEVELRPTDFQTFTSNLKENEPIYVVNYSQDYFDPATFLNIFRSTGRHPHSDPDWDEFYGEINALLDPEKRSAGLKEAEIRLFQDAAFYGLHCPFNIALWPCNKAGEWVEPNKDGYSFVNGAPGMFHAFEKWYWSNSDCRSQLK